MKTIPFVVLFLASIHWSQTSFSQRGETIQFEKLKGKLPFPVCTVYGFTVFKREKYRQVSYPRKDITFITDSAAQVRAIYNGKVCGIYNIEDEYAVVTSFGNYYITYYPLTKPRLKKGDFIFHGQPIAKINTRSNPREINIFMSKKEKFLEPYEWFKW